MNKGQIPEQKLAHDNNQILEELALLRQLNEKLQDENINLKQMFQFYLEGSPDGIAVFDQEGRCRLVNRILCEMLGYEETELRQFTAGDLSANSSLSNIKRLADKGISYNEVELQRKDGTIVPADVHAIVLPHGRYMATFRDATDRKEAEKALKLEVELNALVAELSHMFLSTTEVERIASVLLEKAIELTDSQCGYNGFINPQTGFLTISNLAGNVTELSQDNPVYKEFWEQWGWVLKHKKPLVANTTEVDGRANQLSEGHIPIYKFLYVPALIDNVQVGQITVANSDRDYTERDLKILQRLADIYAIALQRKHAEQKIHDSEQQYDLIINGINDAVTLYEVVDHKYFRFLKANSTLFKILGLQPDEVLGKFVQDVVPREVADIWLENDILAVKSKEMLTAEVSLPYGMFENRYIPVINNVGDCTHLIVVAQNIAGKKKAEEHLLKMQKLESVGILAGGLAHDFNNILTAITGNVSLAKLKLNTMSSPGTEVLFNLLGEAEKATLEAKNLTQQLLTFAKGGAPILKTTSTRELLKGTAEFALRGSNVKCIYQIPEDIWAVEVDEGQVSQVIHNLIINADQAMPGGGRIEIYAENLVVAEKTRLPLKKGKYVKIAICDNGVGIPPELLDKIFDPYFTTKQKGSGLGLTTSYSIIRKHDGLLEVQSEMGIGTRFEMYLPATEEAVIASDKRKNTLTAGKGRVLVMDDEKMLRYMLSEMLKYLGYEAACAKDGDEAIAMYSDAQKGKKTFDAVIMDLTIPGGMGGKQAIQKLMEIDPEVSAIVSSGYSNDPVMSEFEKYGFKDVVTKPYSVEELAEVLRNVIGSHK